MTERNQATPTAHTDPLKVKSMIEACTDGSLHTIQKLVEQENPLYACQQDEETGISPLIAAAKVGNEGLCRYLLEKGAPWNALDRSGQCAGNYATDRQHWAVVNLLVEWGTRAELILGAVERGNRGSNTEAPSGDSPKPLEYEPSTKPDYLRQRLHYTDDGKSLLDADRDAVMMEWERPLMKAHAQIVMETGKRVLNIGFGMGIIDTALQELSPDLHVIVEAHPDVHRRLLETGWDKKPNVSILFGRWQDKLPELIQKGAVFDGIFYDTYGEHFLDLEDFHGQMIQLLSKPSGIYSFFNGLAPDNLFFHGVACQCVKLQLGHLGLDCEFLSCEIQVKDSEWEGIRRKYWHGRDTYYLPRATWTPQLLQPQPATDESSPRKNAASANDGMDVDGSDGKRQRVG